MQSFRMAVCCFVLAVACCFAASTLAASECSTSPAASKEGDGWLRWSSGAEATQEEAVLDATCRSGCADKVSLCSCNPLQSGLITIFTVLW